MLRPPGSDSRKNRWSARKSPTALLRAPDHAEARRNVFAAVEEQRPDSRHLRGPQELPAPCQPRRPALYFTKHDHVANSAGGVEAFHLRGKKGHSITHIEGVKFKPH